MNESFITLTVDSIDSEHLCCAISDKKHQPGVEVKKQWLKERIKEGHVFRKLDAKGKVFIEYAPLETAWVPIEGDGYLYIYCLWVSGSFKGNGYGKALLESCISDAKAQGKSGVCVLSSKKKKPFLSDKGFLSRYDFQTADTTGPDYELLALSFDGTLPHFTEKAKRQTIESQELTIYYGRQCPFISCSVSQVKDFCASQNIPVHLIPIESLKQAKAVPCVFNNWAVFHEGELKTLSLLNEGSLKKLLGI